MTAREVLLDGGSPWGFRMNGGADVGHALRISRVNPGSKAAQKGVREGDVITSINGQPTKCLTNGESHALLRTVGDTLRLGLNQDTNGSPKRRSKEPLKREASSSSTVSTPSTPVSQAAPATSESAPTATSTTAVEEPSGTKVFVRGIWNTVNKTKHRGKNCGQCEIQHKTGTENKTEVQELSSQECQPKASSSKARRLRKLKLKSAKRAEQASSECTSPAVQENECWHPLPAETECAQVNTERLELEEITINEEIIISNDPSLVNEDSAKITKEENGSSASFIEVVEDPTSKSIKSKTKKKNNKSKGFNLTNIFSTKSDKSTNNNEDSSNVEIKDNITSDTQIIQKSVTINKVENPVNIPQVPSVVRDKIAEDLSRTKTNDKVSDDKHNQQNSTSDLPNEDNKTTDENTSPYNSTTVTSAEENEESNSKNDYCPDKATSSVFSGCKTEMMCINSIYQTNTCEKSEYQENLLPNAKTSELSNTLTLEKEKFNTVSEIKSKNAESTRPISIFVVPPDNIAQESETEVNWESLSDLEGKTQPISSDDDDVRPETLIHLPSNDLESSDSLKDGRNGIVQIDDYDLSVQDLYSSFMAPEEEARLRSFLETLNLSKPEEYDDTSSSKSFGDSSSTTSLSETSPIPPSSSDEIVVYRHIKTHSVAETCYIPPRHQRYLDVITEETSDPSDTEKRNGIEKPWENSELIKKNNEIEEIPNDWYGSDEEPETTSDEGGIDTSWTEGKKLDDVEGVEVVFLSSGSDDEIKLRKMFEENLVGTQNDHKPELVVIHATQTQEVKKAVKLQQKVENKEVNKTNLHSMDEIVAILDSTYEINKDIFTKQSSVNRIKKESSELNVSSAPDSINENHNATNINIKSFKSNECDSVTIHSVNSINGNLENSVNLDIFDSIKYESQRDLAENQQLDKTHESIIAITPPLLSRQNSSSSTTSQSTARYNPGQSPMSSEAEDKYDNSSNSKQNKIGKRIYNPKSLLKLSEDVITSMPHGDFYLKKIGFWGTDVTQETGNKEGSKENVSNLKLTSLPPSGFSTRRSSFHELENIYSSQIHNNVIENDNVQPLLMKSPPPSSLTSPPPNDDPWVGIPTSADRRLLVCLSPSQSKDSNIHTPQEATDILDLHKKFVERRGYHESSNNRNSIFSPKSERSCSPDFNSPDLIKLEPYESKKAYTPELLIEAANLLALKEYRQSRFRNSTQSNSFKTPESTSIKINGNVLEKNDGLREVTSCRTEINGDSEGPDTNRSAGTSRLLALLQDSGAPCSSPNNTASSEMERVDKSDDKKSGRTHRYSGSYISEWLTMSENVTSVSESFCKTDMNENIIHPKNSADTNSSKSSTTSINNGINERRQFEADKYKISKKGDIAIIQTPEDNEMPPRKKSERPKSMPSVGIPALSPSGGELFREQMYNEYMNKVAERFERRQQKVIKISSRPTSMCTKPEVEVEKNIQNPPTNKLESEFMNKVRERMSKLGIDLDNEPPTGKEEEKKSTEESLPKHLQEFIELTSLPSTDVGQDTPTGVWSPGATPEPQRKEFNFSAAKEESKEEDSEPIPPVWTPKSAQSSPTTERKFRPVNFESPKPTRKTYTQKSSEEVLKPPTDLPISVDSPSHSASTVSSSSQYLSSTQETVTSTSITATSTTHETSGRLITSSSLPDTSTVNPTITLLQKAREGQLPRGAHYLDQNTTNTSEKISNSSFEKKSSPPTVRPNEVLYSIRREYDSETEDKRPKKIIELSPRKYEGIGPTTKEGIPIVLRSEVQDENQHKWYKRMYDSLQRAEKDSRYPYTSSAGYLSEPEPLGGYDSDITSAKYATLDRRRIRNKDNDFTTSTMPRTKYNAVKHAVDVYKNQPGRIEDYEPGHSSIADKEAKQWWDEVMDIFDGQFEQTQKSSPRAHTPATTSTSKPFMTYALKESGYESDSTLVFKRRDETQQQLSPAEQKQAYKSIQKGGDVPLHGLRKPVPEKPKEPLRGRIPVPHRGSYPPQRRPESPHRYVESEVTIHYRSPVRSEEKEAWSEEELQRRQAEAMRRIYQEERRRKYLQELQDMYSRRHTDNFTPSQKSPIPLNRYDDFVDDLSPGKPRDRTPEPKLVARALYNFVGQSSRELTFRRGDIIYVRRQIDKNWYEGEHNAMIGLFPINYVEIIPYDGIRTAPKRPTEGQARAKFNFQAQTHLELPLVKGELVVLTRRVDNNWFEGRIGNRKGIFPVSYVEVLVEPGERALSPVRVNTPTKPVASPAAHSLHMGTNMSQHHYTPPRPVSYTSLPRQKSAELKQPPVNQTLHIDTQNDPVPYRVLYNYKPQNEDELELVEGETVYVMEKCDDGWYVGSSQRTGYLGTFPGNYVERIV